MATTTKRSAPEVSVIYCGPNLLGGMLNQYTVYTGQIPKHFGEHFEACPALRRLFVPVDDLTATTTAMQQAGTPENVWLNEVMTHFTGGAK